MQRYNKFDEHFDTESEQKPLACAYATNGALVFSHPKPTNKPGSGQAKAGRVKLEGVKPDPKQTDQAPRAMTRAEFAVERDLTPVASEKSFDPADELSPRVMMEQELLDARAELTRVRKAHYEYKKAVEPQLAEIGRLEGEAVSNTAALVRLSVDVGKLPKIEQELAAAKAKNAELTTELVDDNDIIIALQQKVGTIAPLEQELVDARARIAELEAGVDPQVENLRLEALRLEAAMTDSAKTRQELDAAKLESAKTQQELDAATARILKLEDDLEKTSVTRDELGETTRVNKARLCEIHAVVDAAVGENQKACKSRMEAFKPKLDAWAALDWAPE